MAMKMKKPPKRVVIGCSVVALIGVVCVAAFVAWALMPGRSIASWINESGGMTEFRSECSELATRMRSSGIEGLKPADRNFPLPGRVAGLDPQFISVWEEDSTILMDIQLCGGFNHAGLVVVIETPTQESFSLRRRNRTVRKLDEGLFEYWESWRWSY